MSETHRRIVQFAAGIILVQVLGLIALSLHFRTDIPILNRLGRTIVDVQYGSCEENGWYERLDTPRVFDTFAFNTEFTMLRMRLEELHDVVDKFVLVESTRTFSDKPKELHYLKNKHLFEQFHDKIEHVIVNIPAVEHEGIIAEARAHMIKSAQKQRVVEGLDRAGASPTDLVIFSDLDEVPRATDVEMLKKCGGYSFPVTFAMPMHNYDFGCDEGTGWYRASLVQRKNLKLNCTTELRPEQVCSQDLRDNLMIRLGARFEPDQGFMDAGTLVVKGGWHMSYFFPVEDIIAKFGAISHTDRDPTVSPNNGDPEFIKCMINRCKHANGNRGFRYADDSPQVDPRTSDAPEYARQRALEGDPIYSRFFTTTETRETTTRDDC